jgi:hypothetical protein
LVLRAIPPIIGSLPHYVNSWLTGEVFESTLVVTPHHLRERNVMTVAPINYHPTEFLPLELTITPPKTTISSLLTKSKKSQLVKTPVLTKFIFRSSNCHTSRLKGVKNSQFFFSTLHNFLLTSQAWSVMSSRHNVRFTLHKRGNMNLPPSNSATQRVGKGLPTPVK